MTTEILYRVTTKDGSKLIMIAPFETLVSVYNFRDAKGIKRRLDNETVQNGVCVLHGNGRHVDLAVQVQS